MEISPQGPELSSIYDKIQIIGVLVIDSLLYIICEICSSVPDKLFSLGSVGTSVSSPKAIKWLKDYKIRYGKAKAS